MYISTLLSLSPCHCTVADACVCMHTFSFMSGHSSYMRSGHSTAQATSGCQPFAFTLVVSSRLLKQYHHLLLPQRLRRCAFITVVQPLAVQLNLVAERVIQWWPRRRGSARSGRRPTPGTTYIYLYIFVHLSFLRSYHNSHGPRTVSIRWSSSHAWRTTGATERYTLLAAWLHSTAAGLVATSTIQLPIP